MPEGSILAYWQQQVWPKMPEGCILAYWQQQVWPIMPEGCILAYWQQQVWPKMPEAMYCQQARTGAATQKNHQLTYLLTYTEHWQIQLLL